MNAQQIFILIAMVALAVIALMVFVVGKKGTRPRLTPLASYAFAFILAGILFEENRLVGYGLMGIGMVLAMIDIISKTRARQ